MQRHRAGPLGRSLWKKTLQGESEETGLRQRLAFVRGSCSCGSELAIISAGDVSRSQIARGPSLGELEAFGIGSSLALY